MLAQYFVSPKEWSSQAQTVSPLRYRRMDGVCFHSLHMSGFPLSLVRVFGVTSGCFLYVPLFFHMT